MSEKPELENKWETERRESLQREVEAHQARLRDVEDVVRHRAVMEQHDVTRLELHAQSVAAIEREAAAMERIAEALEDIAAQHGTRIR